MIHCFLYTTGDYLVFGSLAFLGAIILVAFIIGLVKTYCSEDRKRKEAQEKRDYNVRIYTYDYAKKSFYFFDKFNLKNTKTYDEQQFINQFVPSDKYRVQDWLRGVAQTNNYTQFIQADLKVKHPNTIIPSMLQLTGVNRQKNIIHFESFLLPYYSTSNNNNPRIFKKFLLKSKEECQDFISNDDACFLGSVYYLKLYRAGAARPNDQAYLSGINKKIMAVLSKFLSKNKKIYLVNDLEEIIIDNTAISRVMTMNTAATIETTITQFLNFNTPDIDLYVAIGVTIGSFYSKSFDQAFNQSLEMVNAIQDNYTVSKVQLYNPNFFNELTVQKNELEEVKMLVKNSTFRVYFTPTLNIKTGEKSIYFVTCVPYGTEIHSFNDVIAMASQFKGGSEQLFKSVNEKCLLGLSNYHAQISLIFRIPYLGIHDFLKSLNKDENSKIEWTLAIKETDLLAYLDDQATMTKTFQKVTNMGLKIAIILANSSPSLPSKILYFASFFVVSTYFTSRLKDSRVINDLRMIGSSYQEFPAPLIYSGLKDFNDIELPAHFGGRIFECDALALPSSRAEELNPDRVSYVMKETTSLLTHKPTAPSSNDRKATATIPILNKKAIK